MKKVYLDELEEVSKELIDYSENGINNKIEELKQAMNNFVWQGQACNRYKMGFNSKIDELVRMNNNLTNLAKYLVKAKESYNDTNSEINNVYEKLLEEFQRIGKW